MVSELTLKKSFKKVKLEIDFLKDELAVALKRISNLESEIEKQKNQPKKVVKRTLIRRKK